MPKKRRFLLTCPKRSKKNNIETDDAKVGDDEENEHLRVDMRTDNIFRDHNDNEEFAIPIEEEDQIFKSDNFSEEKKRILMADDYKPFEGVPKQVNLRKGKFLEQKKENCVETLAQRTYALEAHNRILKNKLDTIGKESSVETLAQRTYALETHNRILKNKLDTIEKESSTEIARLNAEIERLKAEVQKPSTEIERLNAEIERLNAEIETLKAEVQKPAKRARGGGAIERPVAEVYGPMKKPEMVDLTGDSE